MLYRNFQEEQKQAHFQGVKDGQALFQKYMPAGAVELLQQSDCRKILYSYQHPADLKLMAGSLPENYNMLHKTYVEVKVSVMLNLMPKVMKKVNGTTTMMMKKLKKSKKKSVQTKRKKQKLKEAGGK